MKTENNLNLITIVKGLNAFLLIASMGLLVLCISLGITLNKTINNISRTLIPPTISKSFTVSDSNVDESYLSQMADYFMYLKLNVTPHSVERKYSTLMDYIDEGSWAVMQELLANDALQVIKENVSSTFDVRSIQVSLDSMKVKVNGTLKKSVGSRQLEPEELSYIVDLAYNHGALSLLSIRKVKEK
ncbi:hypothetical protein PSSHI_45400 [Photobacterium sp. R1]